MDVFGKLYKIIIIIIIISIIISISIIIIIISIIIIIIIIIITVCDKEVEKFKIMPFLVKTLTLTQRLTQLSEASPPPQTPSHLLYSNLK